MTPDAKGYAGGCRDPKMGTRAGAGIEIARRERKAPISQWPTQATGFPDASQKRTRRAPRRASTGSDRNGARKTDAFGFHELATNQAASLLYTSIHYLPPLDPRLGLSTWRREQVVGLRSALGRTWFVSVRSIADAVLNDQVQKEREIRGDLFDSGDARFRGRHTNSRA
jgi:hypothetical protein